MSRLAFILITAMAIQTATAQNYSIVRSVIASGGGHSQSSAYQLDGTIGQPIIGQSSSPNYRLEAGFWVGAGPVVGGCDYIVGDANNSRNLNGLDVTYGVSYFKGGPQPPFTCDCPPHGSWFVAGDANGSCTFNGLDISYLVSYFKGGPAPTPCPDCPPAAMLIPGKISPNGSQQPAGSSSQDQ